MMAWIVNEIKESVRLYFLPVTNPRQAFRMLLAIRQGDRS